jgi:1,4-alpha-glucan branching enzyme
MHVILTGETDAYYVDYADKPFEHLARCLTEGFAYQGETSAFRHGKPRGESSETIPLSSFINFLQNHDQAGNRPFGERLIQLTDPAAMRAGVAVLLLNPSPPMIFMGEEWGSRQPFPYFCDFGPELSKLVREGRIKDFAVGDKFADPKMVEMIPDPTAPSTFESAILDWSVTEVEPHRTWLAYYRLLLAIRSIEIAPLIDHLAAPHGEARVDGPVIRATWPVKDDGVLVMQVNLSGESRKPIETLANECRIVFATHPAHLHYDMPPWSVVVSMEKARV